MKRLMEEIGASRVFQNKWDLTGKGAREARHGDSGKTRTPEEPAIQRLDGWNVEWRRTKVGRKGR